MRTKLLFLIFFFAFIATSFASPGEKAPLLKKRSAEEVVNRAAENFMKIKDASADIVLDWNLYFFGCSGLRRFKGHGYFKSPDKIQAELEKVNYYFIGNRMRKVDEKGKRFYVRLVNSLDFSPGYNPRLIPHNFTLSILKEDAEDIAIEGTPKPGVLKNVTKVVFHIDPKEYLLRSLDLTLADKRFSGSIKVDYQKIDGIWVPVGFKGRSAIEIRSNSLAALDISLRGENFKINPGLPDKIFEPGF